MSLLLTEFTKSIRNEIFQLESKVKQNHRTQRILCSFFIALISQHVSAPHGGHNQVSIQSYTVGSYCS
jgi:hypothetical protein